MSFDLEKFKAGQPALTRRGDKQYFIHLDLSLKPTQQLIVKSARGDVFTYHPSGTFIYGRETPNDLVGMYEEPPEPRRIDWSKIAGSTVPVKVWSEGYEGYEAIYFLAEYEPSDGIFPFNTKDDCYGSASLETGLWVFNDRGENPWPDGVLVDVKCRGGANFKRASADRLGWSATSSCVSIIASRCVGLEKGWRY